MNGKSLHQFRDFASLLFRVANTGPNHIGNAHSFHSDVDRLLTMHMLVLEERDALSMAPYRPIPMHFGMDCENDNINNECCMREIIRPPTPPTLVIHHDQRGEEIVPNVVVTKDEPEIKTVTVKNAVITQPPPPSEEEENDEEEDSAIVRDLNLGDGDEIESVEPEESEHEAEEEEEEVEAEDEAEEADDEGVEEEVQEAEEEEEDEEGMEIIKIKKKNYFCGEHSKKVYEYIDDESAGDCLGVLKDGRIVPLE